MKVRSEICTAETKIIIFHPNFFPLWHSYGILKATIQTIWEGPDLWFEFFGSPKHASTKLKIMQTGPSEAEELPDTTGVANQVHSLILIFSEAGEGELSYTIKSMEFLRFLEKFFQPLYCSRNPDFTGLCFIFLYILNGHGWAHRLLGLSTNDTPKLLG